MCGFDNNRKDFMILFLDLDGTLLNDEKMVTEGNRRAIERMLERGHRVVIATGRPLLTGLLEAQKLGLCGEGCFLIAYNGGLIYDCGRRRTLFRTGMELSYVRELFDRGMAAGLHVQTFDDEFALAERETPEFHYYNQRYGMPIQLVPDVIAYLKVKPVKTILLDLNGPDRLLEFQRRQMEWSRDKLNCFPSDPRILEYVPLGIDKGRGIRFLCDYLGVPIEHSIAAGDGENDRSMIQAAGTGAVMANASEELKSCGDYVTQNDNNHDGVAEIIERFIL